MLVDQLQELYVLPLSADSSEALQRLRAACAAWIREQSDLAAADLLSSAARRRARAWRAVALGATTEQLVDALEHDEDPNLVTGGPVVPQRAGTRPKAEPATQAGRAASPWALARAFCEGAEVDMTLLLAAPGRGSLPLPPPPLAKRRIWVEIPGPTSSAPVPPATTPVPSPPVEAKPEPAAPAPAASAAPAPTAPSEAILTLIREQTARELGVPADAVEADTTFLDMGADSLLMINMLRILEHELGVRMTVRELFEEADSPALLARMAEERL